MKSACDLPCSWTQAFTTVQALTTHELPGAKAVFPQLPVRAARHPENLERECRLDVAFEFGVLHEGLRANVTADQAALPIRSGF